MTSPQQRLEEIAKQEQSLADEKAKLLADSKDADLDIVKRLCKQHGFTATQLRSVLAKKGKRKPAAAGVVKKAPVKRAAKKKTVKAK